MPATLSPILKQATPVQVATGRSVGEALQKLGDLDSA